MSKNMCIYEGEQWVYFRDAETDQLKDYMVQPDEVLDVSLKGYDVFKVKNTETGKIEIFITDVNNEVVVSRENVTAIRDFIEGMKWARM